MHPARCSPTSPARRATSSLLNAGAALYVRRRRADARPTASSARARRSPSGARAAPKLDAVRRLRSASGQRLSERDERHPRAHRRGQARRGRRGARRGAPGRGAARAAARRRAARLRRRAARHDRRRARRGDRRGQEGEPVQGRAARATSCRPRSPRATKRHGAACLSACSPTRSSSRARAAYLAAGARGLRAAGAAQGLHRRSVPGATSRARWAPTASC